MAEPAPNNALQLTAYSLRFATLRFGFRQQLKAGVGLLVAVERCRQVRSVSIQVLRFVPEGEAPCITMHLRITSAHSACLFGALRMRTPMPCTPTSYTTLPRSPPLSVLINGRIT